jgi:hypothetical protein
MVKVLAFFKAKYSYTLCNAKFMNADVYIKIVIFTPKIGQNCQNNVHNSEPCKAGSLVDSRTCTLFIQFTAKRSGSDHVHVIQEKWTSSSDMERGGKIWDRCYDFLKNICRKIRPKKLAFFTQNKANFLKNSIITLVFEKNANFFAENWQKSQKIVIITSTPGADFKETAYLGRPKFTDNLIW